MAVKLTNWAGNYEYQAATLHVPRTLAEVQERVARASHLKVLGTRHSFNDIADSRGDLISLLHFDQVALDPAPAHPSVTVGAGVTYGQLARLLHESGYALHNLASLPHISVAGACATATHGSGDANGILATAVSAMEIVMAGGEVRVFSRDKQGDTFRGMVVGLGGLGVVTKLTLDLQPTFDVAQEVYENLPLTKAAAHFDSIFSSANSVSLFTDWRSDGFTQTWLKHRIGDRERSRAGSILAELGATPATRNLHPIPGLSAENCTQQMGLPGPWHQRLPHFRMDYTPSSGHELQSEYLVAREHAAGALHAVAGLREQVTPLLQISEVRTIAADDLWMSPCCGQPSVAIHFTWKKDWSAVKELLPQIETRLAPFAARPHWGKLFTLQPSHLQSLYPRLRNFRDLLASHDPRGTFRNAFLDRYIFGT